MAEGFTMPAAINRTLQYCFLIQCYLKLLSLRSHRTEPERVHKHKQM